MIENAIGGSGDDQIYGNQYNNILDGRQGTDTLVGGAGDDTYVVDFNIVTIIITQATITDSIFEYGNGGSDTIYLRGSFANTVTATLSIDYSYYSQIENLSAAATGATKLDLIGNSLNNIITGNSADNLINGGIGADTLIGGLGNDTYIIDDSGDIVTELLNGGIDTVQSSITYSLIDTDGAGLNGGSIENLTLTGADNINATGNAFNNILIGNSGINTLVGGLGADTLDGGLGADNLNGGDGADIYFVDDINDIVTEDNALATGGIDLVNSKAVSFNLGANVENLTLQIASTTDLTQNNINATGNALANIIIGNRGNNLIDGGIGIDNLSGGLGNDTYIIDLTAAGLLQDTVTEGVSTLDTADAIQLRGNSTNTIVSTLILGANIEILDASATGNSKLNLTGNALINSLTGNDTDNILDGGLGADALTGGAGNDTYLVDNVGDSVTEQFNAGTDLVKISIATAGGIYVLGDNIENGTLTNAVAFNLTGNALDNVLAGNAAANVLVGFDGNDSLDGGAGNDSLIGGLGNDMLFGGVGSDTLDGGDGDDTYVVDIATDVIVIDASGNDTVKSSIAYSITTRTDLENITLTGLATINAAGNALANTLIGNDAANILDGGADADAMNGGKGADTYIVDELGDTVTESFTNAQGGGIDLVKSSVSFTLDVNLDNLTLLTASIDPLTLALNNIDATGNELNNIIIGNGGNNILTGNAGNDTLTGNAGEDYLDGGAGVDTMIGGTGNDTYIVDNINDVVIETALPTEDHLVLFDTIRSSVSYTLSNNVEYLVLTGNDNINGTANAAGGSYITGNNANNIFRGGAGGSTFIGLGGDDTYITTLGTAVYYDGINPNKTIAYIKDNIGEAASGGIDTLILNGSIAIAERTLISLNFYGYPTNSPAGYLIYNNYNTQNIENLDISRTGLSKVDLEGNDDANKLTGNAAANTINSGNGDDTLDGGAGLDTLIGGAGNDTYIVDSLAEVNLINDFVGNNTLNFGLTYTLANAGSFTNLNLIGAAAINGTGNNANNILTGNNAANILDGAAGDDTMDGGKGNDTYVADSIGDVVKEQLTIAQGGGIDLVQSSVDFDLSNNPDRANIDNITLIGTAIYATGNALANTLTGNAGSNVLDGKEGIDTLIGGLGNDSYYVDLTAAGLLQDTVIEAVSLTDVFDAILLRGNSTNTIVSTLTLGANIEILDASATGSSKLNLTGNALINSLIGNAADNILDGGLGADSLTGGKGNDTYLVDNVGDSVTEQFNEGTDLVKISLAVAGAVYTLGDNIENATLTNAVAFNLTGNALDNILTGNAASNIINGGIGADTLVGGLGNDIYVVDNVGDIVTELVNSGIDTVQSSVTYSLIDTDGAGLNGGNIEHLTLTGADNINATGNAFNNIIIGNAGSNILDGLAGNDSLNGGDGSDTLNGGLGADTLDGGTGADSLIGGDGADIYFVDDIGDSVTEDSALAAGGIDLVNSKAASFTLSANVENLILLTVSTTDLTQNNINAAGNELNNIIIGNGGDNTLIGNAGNDTLTGNAGNDYLNGGLGNDNMNGGNGDDTYVVDSILDIVTESIAKLAVGAIGTDGGFDTVQASITYALGLNIDALLLTGLANLNGTGNTLDNYLIGNDGNNILNGMAGNDILTGGLGNDSLLGGLGNDTLDGGMGDDQLIGGDGSDTYVVDSVNDQVFETNIDAITGGTDLVISSIDYVLGANLENLNLTGAAVSAAGNALNNIIIGNDQNNVLNGNIGNDTLIGGLGDDSLVGGDGNDVLTGGLGSDMLTGGLGADRFVFNFIAESNPSLAEIITDFSHIQLDKIDLSAIDANSNTAINDAFTFATSFTGVAGQVVYDANTFSILADTNGDSAADFFINIWGVSTLVASDFVL